MTSLTTFAYAWLQVTLIAMNTYQIANQKFIGALLVGFLISLIWTVNVGRVAFGCNWTRLIYATGAMAGTGTGLFLTQLIYLT